MSVANETFESGFGTESPKTIDTGTETDRITASGMLEGTIKEIGAALLVVGVVVIILNEFLSSYEAEEGPLSETFDSLEGDVDMIIGFVIILVLVAVAGVMLRLIGDRF